MGPSQGPGLEVRAPLEPLELCFVSFVGYPWLEIILQPWDTMSLIKADFGFGVCASAIRME